MGTTPMLEAGLAAEDITPAEGVPLFGYGDRTHDSEGVHDPLRVYAWWLRPPDSPPLVWVVLDLCVLGTEAARALASGIRGRLEDDELADERILVSTTHTHSGPDTWNIAGDPRPWAQRYLRLLVERAAAAVRRAREGATEGFLEVRLGQGSLGINRRDPRLPVDRRLVAVSLRDREEKLRGVVFHYSCHLTVLGVDNYLVSADWLGPLRTSLEGELEVPVAFIQGAEGNIDPSPRGALDMADPDQARGSSFATMGRLAAELAEDVRQALETPAVARLDGLRLRALEAALPLRYGALSDEEVRAQVQRWKESFASFLGIPVEAVPEDMSINALIKERCRELDTPAAEVRGWVAQQFAYTAFLYLFGLPREGPGQGSDRESAASGFGDAGRRSGASEEAGGPAVRRRGGTLTVPLRIVDFGPLVLLAVPAEVLSEAALEWQERFPDRTALIAGLAGGWIGYLPHASNFAEAKASERYETVSTLFAPEAAGVLLDSAARHLS